MNPGLNILFDEDDGVTPRQIKAMIKLIE